MRNSIRSLLAMVGLLAMSGVAMAQTPSPGDLEFFEKKIRPVLSAQCYQCHSTSAKKLKAGLFLDSREGMLKGGENGAVIAPGKSKESALLIAVAQLDDETAMPPKRGL